MAYLASLPAGAELLDVFRAYPQITRLLLGFHQALLRDPSPLAVAERELIVTYAQGLNARGYGYGVHQAVAQTFELTGKHWARCSPTSPLPQRAGG